MGSAKLGELELLVLLAAIRLGERAYAVSIVDEIRAQTGRAVQRATVYVVLKRLEEKRLVATRFSEPLPERGGRKRRLVRVTPTGLLAVRELRDALQNMWSDLDPVLEDG